MGDLANLLERVEKAGPFYILSLKWTSGETVTWWRPDSAGYTTDLLQAGVYSAADVLKHRSYYDNGKDTLAVPVSVAERYVMPRKHVANSRSVYGKLRRARNVAMRTLAAAAPTARTETGADLSPGSTNHD